MYNTRLCHICPAVQLHFNYFCTDWMTINYVYIFLVHNSNKLPISNLQATIMSLNIFRPSLMAFTQIIPSQTSSLMISEFANKNTRQIKSTRSTRFSQVASVGDPRNINTWSITTSDQLNDYSKESKAYQSLHKDMNHNVNEVIMCLLCWV